MADRTKEDTVVVRDLKIRLQSLIDDINEAGENGLIIEIELEHDLASEYADSRLKLCRKYRVGFRASREIG